MKNFLTFLTLFLTLLITGSSMAADTVAKINFCLSNGEYDQEGWTSVYGTESTWPIDLGNGMTLVKVDGILPHLGPTSLDDLGNEVEGFPANVQNSANYLANTTEAYTLGFKITGLDPNEIYNFDIYSRAWGSSEKIAKFSVNGDDTISINSTVNDEEVISFTDLQPDAIGELTLSVTKNPGSYAFVNGWIVTKQETSIPQVNTDNAYAKINFTAEGYEQDGWPSIYGNASFPATIDNGIVVDIASGTLGGGPNGEPLTSLPENVGPTYNFLSSSNNDAVILTFSGLEPNFMYTFDIFASRDSGSSSGDKTTFFSIGEDTVSIDALGNTDVLVSIVNVQVPASGIVELTIDRPDGQAGYINVLIITKGMEFVNTNGAYAKINFTAEGYEQDGWPSVYANSSLPVTIDNGIVVDITGGTISGGARGEPNTSLPENVGPTYNFLSSGDNDAVILTFSGLDPNFMYTFDIFASRDSGSSSGDKTTFFSIGDDTVSIDALGNTDVLLSIENIRIPASGVVELTIDRPDGQAGYINALIITQGMELINGDDAYAKINFTAEGYEQDGWPSVYANSSLPATIDNGIVVDITGGTISGGARGEPNTSLPENVGPTYNFLSSSDNDAVILTFTGLDPDFTYTFDIFASRDSGSSSGDKTTFFSIGEDTVSIDALGNTDVLLSIENVEVPTSGVVELTIDRPDGQAGYINALIITQEGGGALLENVALNKPAAATSIEGTGFEAKYAFDGDLFTRWASAEVDTDFETICVDLQGEYEISNVVITWEAAYGLAYTIDVSDDSINWTTLYSTTTGDGDVDDIAVSGTGRYVRLDATDRGTVYAYSIYEFEVYGIETTADNAIYVDFGAEATITEGWNNLTDAADQTVVDLVNGNGNNTGISIQVHDVFNGVNESGTTTPDASLGIPASSTSDSFFGSAVEFDGKTEPTGGVTLSGLEVNREYTLSMFGSRDATDNRETEYKVTGNTEETVYLNVAGNTSLFAVVTGMRPAADGTITIDVAPGPNNDNSYQFYYFGALKIEAGGYNAVKRFDQPNNVTCYPVPCSNQLTITNVPHASTVAIYSIAGKKMIEQLNSGSISDMKMNVENLKCGIYLVRVTNANKVITSMKLIKK